MNSNKRTNRRRILGFVLTLLAMSWGVTPAMAQTHNKAVIAALDTIVRNYSISMREKVHQFVENKWLESKKDPEIAVGIAKAFFKFARIPHSRQYGAEEPRDTAMAYEYLDRAIKSDPTYVPAYVRLGDISRICKDTVKALEWYEKGIKANLKSPEGYLAYAKILLARKDTTGAKEKVSELLQYNPTYPIYCDLAMAAIDYYDFLFDIGLDDEVTRGDSRFVMNLFNSTSVEEMGIAPLSQYCFYLLLCGENASAYEAAKYAMDKYPNEPLFIKNALHAGAELFKMRKEVYEYGKILFTKYDTIDYKMKDYTAYAQVLRNMNKYQEAGDYYWKGYLKWKSDMEQEVIGTDPKNGPKIVREIMKMYKEEGMYDEAEVVAKEWIQERQSVGKLDPTYVQELIKIYEEKAKESFGDSRTELLQKQDSVWGWIAEISDESNLMGIYAQRMNIAQELDTLTSENNTFVWATKIVETYEALSGEERTSRNNNYYWNANYRLFLIYKKEGELPNFYYCKDLFLKATDCLRKMLDVDPENADLRDTYESHKKFIRLKKC